MVAAMTAGCGAVPAPHPGSSPHTGRPASPTTAGTAAPAGNPATPGRNAATSAGNPAAPAGNPAAGVAAGCQGAASAGTAGTVVTVTLAGNSKIYCLRVGDTLRLALHGTEADPWQSPLITGTALKQVPGAGPAVINGITSATYTAVGPGQVLLASVRPPCRFAFAPQKGGLQPRFTMTKLSPGRSCSPGRFFSTSISVLR
jgi:hypothetical protein